MPIIQSGTVNPTAIIVPDLYVVIVPPSQLLLNGVPSNVVGLVGTASYGPVNTPLLIQGMANFSQAFGPVVNRKYDMGTHAAIISLQGGTAMQCVRVSDGTDTAAEIAVGTTDITFTSKFTGSFGNNISVTLQNGAKANTISAVIGVPGYAAEIFQNIPRAAATTATTTGAVATATTVVVDSTASLVVGMVVSGTGVTGGPTVATITDATHFELSAAQTISSGTILTFTPTNFASTWTALADAVNNGQNALRQPSSWVVAEAGVGTTMPSLPAIYHLTGGTDGEGVTASDIVGDSATVTGMYALSGLNIAILDVCDLDDDTEWTTIDAFAQGNSSYAIQVLPAGTSVSGAVTAKRTAGLDSGYSKLLHGDWLYWNDPVNGITRLVSPQAFVAGRLSNLTPQNVTLNKPIFGVAGSQKTGISTINQTAYTTADLSSLFQNGIEVVTNPGAGNLAIWTCRSGHTSSTNLTLQLDNYPTLTNFIAKTLANGMGFYIGALVTPKLFQDITATLTQFMQNLTGAGFLSSPDGTVPYAVQCNTQNNPSSQVKLGIVTASVQAEYPTVNQTFIINMQGGSTIDVTVQNQG